MKDKKEREMVVISDIKIPFMSVLWLMVEIGIAAIPAAFCVAAAYSVFTPLLMWLGSH